MPCRRPAAKPLYNRTPRPQPAPAARLSAATQAHRVEPMTATQKYLFDLHGFVIVEDVLDDAQCELAKSQDQGPDAADGARLPTATTRAAPGTAPPTWSTPANRSPP